MIQSARWSHDFGGAGRLTRTTGRASCEMAKSAFYGATGWRCGKAFGELRRKLLVHRFRRIRATERGGRLAKRIRGWPCR